ncbi:MAG TPA: hypothetical protein VG867_05700 [Rhizomicrobium sp.]|nr:hypothetical protein [Rhizomicrobium sp.]
MDAFDQFLGLFAMAAVPGYFVLQPMALLRYRGGWRKAAMVPLVGGVPTILWSLVALSHESNLWPLTFILFAPLGTFYLVVLMSAHWVAYTEHRI